MTSRASAWRSKSIARCPASRVARVLDRLHAAVGLPQTIVVDNGPEFAGRTLDAWAYARGVTLRFIRPGKPIENAYVESFNGKFRDECLNEHWFVNLVDAKAADRSLADRLQHRPAAQLRSAARTPHHFAKISTGARRLSPARPDEEDEIENPRTSHYPCSGFWGQVSNTAVDEGPSSTRGRC